MNTQNFEKTFSEYNVKPGFYDGKGAVVTLDGGLSVMQDNITLKDFTLLGNISVLGANFTLENCTVKASGTAILSSGEGLILRGNVIEGAEISVALEGGSYNALVAQNTVDGDITVTDAFNSAVVLNSAKNLVMRGSTNVYAAENTLHGSLTLCENDYLIADRNISASVTNESNINMNGDNVTDIIERADCGALAKNQPHTNRDLFVGMERQTVVRDASLDEELTIDKYIPRKASENDVVIVPPGVYSTSEITTLRENCSNTKILAYGVCIEITEYGPNFEMFGANNMEIHGLTWGYSKQSCGQAHVLKQLGDYDYLIVPSAGMIDDFASTNPDVFSSGIEYIPQGGKYVARGSGGLGVTKNGDGTMTLSYVEKVWAESITPGDMLVCRIKSPNRHSVQICNCKNVLVRDTVIYGYASGLAIMGCGTSENVRFERHHNTVHTGSIIDKATYDRYKSLESEYGVDLGIYRDALGRYRGCPSVAGSIDSFHVVSTRKGIDVTSSILEQMLDDGSNQRGCNARLHALRDNGDGTATLVYKSNLAKFYHLYFGKGNSVMRCIDFKKGDSIFAYNSGGMVLCDTQCLSDAVEVGSVDFTVDERKYNAKCFEVTLPSKDINFEAIEGYDLSDNHYAPDNKVFVDNLSRNSTNVVFDNVTIRNSRARGMLFNTRNVTAKNCTVKNISCSAFLIHQSNDWGESTIGSNITIKNCIIDNLGFINKEYHNTSLAPITILGYGNTVGENTLPNRNIVIEGNRFKNNLHDYAICIKSAQDIKIINNVFEPGRREYWNSPQSAIYIDTAMNVEISGNRYSKYLKGNNEKAIVAKNFKNIYGDVVNLDGDIES